VVNCFTFTKTLRENSFTQVPLNIKGQLTSYCQVEQWFTIPKHYLKNFVGMAPADFMRDVENTLLVQAGLKINLDLDEITKFIVSTVEEQIRTMQKDALAFKSEEVISFFASKLRELFPADFIKPKLDRPYQVIHELVDKVESVPVPIADATATPDTITDTQINLTYGERLITARKGLGLNQSQLSELSGIAASQISKYETGDHKPAIKNRRRLADLLGPEFLLD
jgi:DNA-binding XRE family transcriptional regulator